MRFAAEAPEQLLIATELAVIGLEWVDACGTEQACYEVGTGWSFVFAWNASWLIIMGFNFLTMMCGAFYWWPRFFGAVCNYFLCIMHLVGIIFTGVALGSPYGRICSYNKSINTYEGDYKWDWEGNTYDGDHGLLLATFVLMLIFWIIQVTCCCLPCCMTPVKEVGPKEKEMNLQVIESTRAPMSHPNVAATGQAETPKMFYH